MIEPSNLFHDKLQQLFEELGDHAIGALATCYNGKPYVRSVSCIFLNGKIYFQSDKTMSKASHIKATPFVSVCFQHVQIQGTCEELNHPLHTLNEPFLQLFTEHYPRAAQRYSHIDNERVYRITPTRIETWRYIDGMPYQEVFDIDSEIYQLQKYEI